VRCLENGAVSVPSTESRAEFLLGEIKRASKITDKKKKKEGE